MNEEKEDYFSGTIVFALIMGFWAYLVSLSDRFAGSLGGIFFFTIFFGGGYLIYRYYIVQPITNLKNEMEEKLRNIWFGGNDSILDIKYLKEIMPEKAEEIESKLRNTKTANDFKKSSSELRNIALITRKKLLEEEIKKER